MCGICGIYDSNTIAIDKNILKAMNDSIKYRGPDDSGFFFDDHLALAHRRLSIIDLKTGQQPIHNENEDCFVVYNGEIYNFAEIRERLESKGHRFYTNTDTEVIVHAYEEYGESCLEHFNGMFAFAIWDAAKKKLFLARDRLGIKPLYYYYDGSKLVFASELKSIIADRSVPKEVDLNSLNSFFAYEYVPAPLTILKGISKLPPGHYLTLTKGSNLEIKKYWDVTFREKKGFNRGDKNYYTKEIFNLLKCSVKKRLIADVPVGAFLSGGIDSSAIVAAMSHATDQIKTFSIGFEQESYSELNDARLVAQRYNTEHHEKVLDVKLLINLLNTITKDIDEPFGDLSIFPTYLVAQFARKHVKVVLSGDGGDELFAGYDWYLANRLYRYYRFFPGHKLVLPSVLKKFKQRPQSKGLINKSKRFTEGVLMDKNLGHLRWMTSFTAQVQKEIYADLPRNLSNPFKLVENHAAGISGNLNKMLYVDIKTYLPDDILTKVDRASMFNSLEARVPFLDYTFVEFSATIPQRYKLSSFERKHILKKALLPHLPKQILYKDKQGFTMPMKHWLRHELKDLMLETLSEQKIKEVGFLNPEYVSKVINQHLTKTRDNQRHIWAMMNFQMWHQNYLV